MNIKKVKKFIIIIFLAFLSLKIIAACGNKNKYSAILDEKYLELYQQLEIQEYGQYVNQDNLSEEEINIIYADVRIREIDFDRDESLLWCLSTGDGRHIISIYDKNGKKTEYWHTFTTSGGDEGGDWYDKYVEGTNDAIDVSEEEVRGIFKKFDNLNVDNIHALNLIINNKKAIPEHIYPKTNLNQETILFGKYNQVMFIDTRVEWRVLYKDETKALLLSSKILDWKKFNNNDKNTEWNDSDLKNFVNEVYYNKIFSPKEKTAIIPNKYGENCSLLDDNDIDNYLYKNNILYLKAKCSTSAMYEKLMNKYPEAKEYKLSLDGFDEYWIKSITKTNEYKYINDKGEICSTTINESKGVRPVIWVALK